MNESANDIKQVFNTLNGVILYVNIIQPPKITALYLNTTRVNMTGMWFNRKELIMEIGKELKKFQPFAEASAELTDQSYLVQIDRISD